MEDPWDVGEGQPLSFYGHCLLVAHEHMWGPTVSHPNVRYNRVWSGLQHGIETTVWATQVESHSEGRMGEKEVVHLGGVPNTYEEEAELPFLVQLGSFSFVPTIHNKSLDSGKQPSGPSSGRFHLQCIGWDHGPLQEDYNPCVPGAPLTWASGMCNCTGSHGLAWAFFPGIWTVPATACNCKD